MAMHGHHHTISDLQIRSVTQRTPWQLYLLFGGAISNSKTFSYVENIKINGRLEKLLLPIN